MADTNGWARVQEIGREDEMSDHDWLELAIACLDQAGVSVGLQAGVEDMAREEIERSKA